MTDWRHYAECAGEDPELFFPVGETGPAILQIEDAKAVCHRCPVTADCLADALRQRIPEGIYGATTPRERQRIIGHAETGTQRHGDDLRDTAVHLYRAHRPSYSTDWNCYQAIAGHLGLGVGARGAKTVRAWIAADRIEAAR